MKVSVVDLSHWDDVSSYDQIREAGIHGVIYKATEGTGYKDPTYRESRERARMAGLLWGAYHFANDSNAGSQARYFAEVASIGPEDLFALDWEPNSPNTMTPNQAKEFVVEIETILGRTNQCLVYGSSSFLTEQIPAGLDAFFGARRLWLAQYGPKAEIPPTWDAFWLWQFTGDGVGPEPHTVPGISGNVDNNFFDGSDADLVIQWAAGVPANVPPSPSPKPVVLITIQTPPGVTVEIQQAPYEV